MNTITIEWSAEDRARIDRLTDALERRIAQVDDLWDKYGDSDRPRSEYTPETPKNEPEKAEPVKADEHPADVSTAPWEPVEEPQEKEGPVAVQELQKLVVDLCAKGKKDQVREVVNAYAKKVSDIPEDKRNEVYAQLTALEG